jgi:nucleoside-diphosphate-sugar epimerase
MRAAITGANGFIGATLTRKICENGGRVAAIVRQTSDLSLLDTTACELHTTGLSRVETLSEAFAGADVVFHCAARSSDWGSIDDFRADNVDPAVRVVTAASRAGVERLVHISSTVVYGFHGHVNANEATKHAPSPFPYCVTKLEGEREIVRLSQKLGIECVIIRPGNVYGPGDRVTFAKLLPHLEKGDFAHVSGGRSLTCPTYVDHLVDALIKAAEVPGIDGEDFIITDGHRVNWRDFIDATSKALDGRQIRLSFSPWIANAAAGVAEWIFTALARPEAPPITRYRVAQTSRDYHFSIDKAKRLLGYEPSIPLEEALCRTIAWYRGKRVQ